VISVLPYREWPAVNWSTLKAMRDSPMHYKWAVEHQYTGADTPAFALGRAAHALTFEPELFDRRFAVHKGARKGKKWAEFKAIEKAKGRAILRPSETSAAHAIAAAARAYPPVQPYLGADGVYEVPLLWTDPVSGVICKGQLDWISPSQRAVIDLKTCRTADRGRFGSMAASYGYHTQLAHYAAGVEVAYGWRPETVALLAVESAPPHDVALYVLDDALEIGRAERAELLARVAEHMESDTWPGRYSEPQILDLPSWAQPDSDVDFDVLEAE